MRLMGRTGVQGKGKRKMIDKKFINKDGSVNWRKRASVLREAERRKKREHEKREEKKKTRAARTKKVKIDSKKYKSELDSAWSIAVRKRDCHKCVMCGADKSLSAHHWILTKAQGNASRWEIDNGVTVCYACHMFKIHQGSWFYSDALYKKMLPVIGQDRINRISSLLGIKIKFTLDFFNEKMSALKDSVE